VDEFGTSGKVIERAFGAGGNRRQTRTLRRREALDENPIATSKFDAIDKTLRWREIDAAGFDEMGDIAGGVSRSKAAEDFSLVNGSGLSEKTGREKRDGKREG